MQEAKGGDWEGGNGRAKRPQAVNSNGGLIDYVQG